MATKKEITITIQCPSQYWNKETRSKWVKFRQWIEEKGGQWTEGMGMHQITFEPVEE